MKELIIHVLSSLCMYVCIHTRDIIYIHIYYIMKIISQIQEGTLCSVHIKVRDICPWIPPVPHCSRPYQGVINITPTNLDNGIIHSLPYSCSPGTPFKILLYTRKTSSVDCPLYSIAVHIKLRKYVHRFLPLCTVPDRTGL